MVSVNHPMRMDRLIRHNREHSIKILCHRRVMNNSNLFQLYIWLRFMNIRLVNALMVLWHELIDYNTNIHHQPSVKKATLPTWNQQLDGNRLDDGVQCATGAEGRYPHPKDCTKFLNCFNGRTYIQSCGPGTAWNSVMETCDHMIAVNCHPSTASVSTTTSTSTLRKTTYCSRFIPDSPEISTQSLQIRVHARAILKVVHPVIRWIPTIGATMNRNHHHVSAISKRCKRCKRCMNNK